jgi:hypothetical protein
VAQLRDKTTSALIVEGTPLEVASVAQDLGFDEVLFDDVGAAFDPLAVIAAHKENVEGLAAAAVVATDGEAGDPPVDLAEAHASALREHSDVKRLRAVAEREMRKARARVGR